MRQVSNGRIKTDIQRSAAVPSTYTYERSLEPGQPAAGHLAVPARTNQIAMNEASTETPSAKKRRSAQIRRDDLTSRN